MPRISPSKTPKDHAAGALSGAALRGLLESKNLSDRLVIAPLLEPEEQLRDEQASVDVRLGSSFVLAQASAVGTIDEFSRSDSRTWQQQVRDVYKEYYVPIGTRIVIHPHQLLLATTLEYLRLPRDIMCYVVGRSTWGRLGLIVATAVGVHPLFAGALTLELRNLGETPLTLYPGQAIAQLFFHHVDEGRGTRKQETASGQYSGSIDPIPGRLSSKRTKSILDHLSRSWPTGD